MLREAVRPVRLASMPNLDPAALRWLTATLLAAAVMQLVLLRLVVRVGVHLPKNAPVRGVMELVSLAGGFALNLTSILVAILVAAALATALLRTRNVALRWLIVLLGSALFWGLGLSLLNGGDLARGVFGLASSGLVLVLATLLPAGLPPRSRLVLFLIALAYVAYQYYALGYLAYGLLGFSDTPPAAVEALRLGELLAVLAGFAIFWAWGAKRWRRAGVVGGAFAVVPVLVLFSGSLAPAATTSILVLWTAGLSMYLPLPLYLLSLGLYLLTAAACMRSESGFWTAAGLLFVLVAGYMPEATYDHLLLIFGVLLLAGFESWEPVTRTRRVTGER